MAGELPKDLQFEEDALPSDLQFEGVPVSKEPGDLVTPAAPEPVSSLGSKLTSAGRAVQNAGTFGFADEALAFLGSDKLGGAGKYLRTPIGELLEGHVREDKSYDDSLKEIRGDFEKSHEANPGLSTGVELGTAVLMPGPGKAKAATALGRLAKTAATSTGLGALFGLGNSRADLAGGDVAGAARDVGVTAALSGVGSLIPGAAGEAGKKLIGKAASGIERATADAKAKVALEAQKAVSSAAGAKGNATMAGRNNLDVLREIVARAGDLPADLVEMAKQKLASPEARKLEENVFENALDAFSGKQGTLNAAKEKLQEAIAQNTPEALAAAEREFLSNPVLKQVWPRFKKQLVDRALIPGITGAAGAAAGGILGDDGAASAAGGGVGIGAGMIANQMLGGRPSSAMEKMLAHPSVRQMGWRAVEKAVATGNKLLGRWEAPLAAAAAQGASALRETDEKLAREDPAYAAAKLQLLLDEGLPQQRASVTPADYGSVP